MPSIAITQPYEAVYIVDPDLGDEQIGTITEKYSKLVADGGGAVEKIDVWERRRLAYEIKGRTEGIYVVMQFQAKPPVEAELRRIFQISEDQIRFLIIRRDDQDAPLPTVNAEDVEPVEVMQTVTEPITELSEPSEPAEAVAETTEIVTETTEPAATPEPVEAAA